MSKYKSSEFLKAVRGASFKILAGGTAGTHTHTHTHTFYYVYTRAQMLCRQEHKENNGCVGVFL